MDLKRHISVLQGLVSQPPSGRTEEQETADFNRTFREMVKADRIQARKDERDQNAKPES